MKPESETELLNNSRFEYLSVIRKWLSNIFLILGADDIPGLKITYIVSAP